MEPLAQIAAIAAILSFIYVMIFGGRGLPEIVYNAVRAAIRPMKRLANGRKRRPIPIKYSPPETNSSIGNGVWDDEANLIADRIAGEPVTIVHGPPGAGKSTVVGLAQRILLQDRVVEGAIRYRCPSGQFSKQGFLKAVASRLSAPSRNDDGTLIQFQDIASRISERNALLVIDNLENWSDDIAWLLHRVDELGHKPRIVVTANCAVPWPFVDRSVKISGMQRPGTNKFIELEARRVGGDELAQRLASSDMQEELHELTAGNPLAIKWIIYRISEGEDADHLLDRLRTGDLERFYFEVFGRFWSELSQDAKRVIEIVCSFPNPTTREIVLDFTKGTKFSKAEDLDFSSINLLENVNTSSGPHIDVHPITRKHVAKSLANDKRFRGFFVKRASHAMAAYCQKAHGLDININSLQDVYDQVLNVIFVARLIHAEGSSNEFVEFVEKIEDFLLIFGFFNERIEFNLSCAELAHKEGNKQLEAHFRITSAGALTAVGRQDQAVKQAETAKTIGLELGDSVIVGRAGRIASTVSYRSAKIPEAIKTLKEAESASADADDQENLLEIDFLMACIQLWQGNHDTASKAIERGLRRARSLKWERGELYLEALQAHLSLLEGNSETAGEIIDRSSQKAKRTQDKRLVLMYEYTSALKEIQTGSRKSGLGQLRALKGDYELLGMPNEQDEIGRAIEKFDRIDMARLGLGSIAIPNHFGGKPIYGI